MTCHSKSYYDNALMKLSCADIIHPWNPSCRHASAELLVDNFFACLKYFSLPYAASLFLKIRAKKEINVKNELKRFCGSIIFGLIFVVGFVSLNCLFRNILGVLNYYVYMYITPMTSGLGIFFENPERRNIVVTTFITMALEAFYRSLVNRKVIKPNKFGETAVFMLLNGLLMYLIRKLRKKDGRQINNWFFVPETMRNTAYENDFILKEETAKTECAHPNSCLGNLKKELTKFGSIAMLISLIKLTFSNIKSPSRIFKQMFEWNNLKLTASFMTYIGVYRVISCFLCKQKGDSLENTFIAGTIAGLSYALNSNKTILFSVLTALIQIAGMDIKRKHNIPNLPYTEISFLLANSFILQSKIRNESTLPQYMDYLLSLFSNNKYLLIINKFDTLLNRASEI